MKAIRDVEIFATGTHNGDNYTEADLDEMVKAHRDLDYEPALKIGHSKDSPGAPAYGWVRNLRRTGTKLVADFEDMHDSVVDAIRERKYARVSSEIYFNLKRGGRTFRRALKAVALLGAEIPAVAGLVPLHKLQFSVPWVNYGRGPSVRITNDYKPRNLRFSGVFDDSYGTPISDATGTSDADAAAERYEAGVQINRLMGQEIEQHPNLTQADALKRVLNSNPELAEVYRGHPMGS